MRRFSSSLKIIWILIGVLAFAVWWFSGDPLNGKVWLNTVLLGVSAFWVAVGPAAWIAFRGCRSASRWERGLARLVPGMLLVPLYLQVAAWEAVFGKLAWLTYFKGRIFQGLIDGWPAAIWCHAVAGVPWLVLIFLLGQLGRVNRLEEQALLDASPRRVFWKVTLNQMVPLLGVGAIWMMVTAAREIAVTDIYQIGTYAEQVYVGFSLGRFNTGIQGSRDVMQSFGWLAQLVLVVWLMLSALVVVNQLFATLTDDAFADFRPVNRTTNWRRQAITFALVGVLVLVPLLGLASRAGMQVANIDGNLVPQFSLESIGTSLVRAVLAYRMEFYWSAAIGGTAALATVLLGLPAAWCVTWGDRRARLPIFFAVALSLSLPYPLVGILLNRLVLRLPSGWLADLCDRSILAPTIAAVTIGFGICTLVLAAGLARIPRSVMESTETEGAGRMARFWRLGVKANGAAILVAMLVAFLLATADVAANFLVLPAGMDTIGRQVLGQLHSGVDDTTAAIGLLGFLGSIGLMGVASSIWRRGQKRGRHNA